MSYAKAKARYEAQQAPEVVALKCAAHGCPRRGSISYDGGSLLCGAHASAEPDRWQSITHELRSLDWLSGLIGDLQKLWNAGKWDDARRMAREMFEPNDELAPTKDELQLIPKYMQRLHLSLMRRVGAMHPVSNARASRSATAAHARDAVAGVLR